MKIPFKKKSNIPKHKKDGRINPHKFWSMFVIAFLAILTVIIISLTYFFIYTSKSLDKPAVPKLDTNLGQVKKIEELIQNTENAIKSRIEEGKSSQIDSSIVQ